MTSSTDISLSRLGGGSEKFPRRERPNLVPEPRVGVSQAKMVWKGREREQGERVCSEEKQHGEKPGSGRGFIGGGLKVAHCD